LKKYTPTIDDMYDTTPCFICGEDVLDEGAETCSEFCKQQMISFQDDWDWWQWKNMEDYMEG